MNKEKAFISRRYLTTDEFNSVFNFINCIDRNLHLENISDGEHLNLMRGLQNVKDTWVYKDSPDNALKIDELQSSLIDYLPQMIIRNKKIAEKAQLAMVEREEQERIIKEQKKQKLKENRDIKAEIQRRKIAELQEIEQAKYQSIWLQIKQNYQSDLLNELLQIHYPEHEGMIAGGQGIDFLKVILKGKDIDKIQDISFFFADKIHLPYNDKKRHTFIVASNGSGKSELIKYLIWQEFKHDKTGLILIDPHGDLAEQVAKLKGKKNEKLVYISTRLSPEHTPIFNPFDVDNRNPLEVERQAKDMVIALGEIVDTSFSEYMQRVLFPCIYLLMMRGNRTISDLVDMMRDTELEKIKRIAKTLPNERVRAFFEHDFENKQFEGTKHSINSKLGNLIDETPFRELTTGKNTIDLKKYINEGYKVIFDLSGLSKDAKNAFGKMIVAQLQFLAYSRENSEFRPSVFVYIDEFQRFVSNSINEGLAELRKFGFHFILATQNITQLDTTTANNVLSNTNIKIVGQNDPQTNKKMSVQLGIDDDYLSKLKVGQFYIKARSSDSAQYVTVPSDLIDKKASINADKWATVRAEQIDKYYELRATTTRATAEPSEPHREQATGDQNDPLKEFGKPTNIKPLEMDI
jgi:Type IV secretion-system coupling protein DNA-binding domain